MPLRIRSPNDLWVGLLYAGVGGAALWIGADYKMGSASRMGPGYFPKVLAALLIVIGLASFVRAFLVPGPPVVRPHAKPFILILLANVLFGFLLNRAGLIVALPALVITSAAASAHFRLDWRALAGVVALTVSCAVVFVYGLNVPMPLVGPWLEALSGIWAER